jgi:hypothetical protein
MYNHMHNVQAEAYLYDNICNPSSCSYKDNFPCDYEQLCTVHVSVILVMINPIYNNYAQSDMQHDRNQSIEKTYMMIKPKQLLG